jgi:hypothetical protein
MLCSVGLPICQKVCGERTVLEAIPDQEKLDNKQLAIELEQRVMELEQDMHAVGWVIQNRNEMNLDAAPGVAVRDFPGVSTKRAVDYLLFVNGRAAGIAWNARSLFHASEREIRDASDVRGTNAFPVPFKPLPLIVFQDQFPAARTSVSGHFRVIRSTGPIGAKSHENRFPSPAALSHLLVWEKIFRSLGGRSLRRLIQYVFATGVGQFEVTSGDRERRPNYAGISFLSVFHWRQHS